jgi:hypothetical protein
VSSGVACAKEIIPDEARFEDGCRMDGLGWREEEGLARMEEWDNASPKRWEGGRIVN